MTGGDVLARVSTVVRAGAKRPVIAVAAVVALLAVAGGVVLVALPSKPSNPSNPGAASEPTATTVPTTGPPGSDEPTPSTGPAPSDQPSSDSASGTGSGSRAGTGSGGGGIPGLPTGTTVQPGSGSGGNPDGFPVTLDGSQLGADTFFINGVTGRLAQAGSHVVRLKPGAYQAATTALSGVSFTVGADGTVGYDSSLAGFLSGAGTSTLTLRGAPVTIDATGLTNQAFDLEGETLMQPTIAARSLRLLPGQHQFEDGDGNNPFRFGLSLDGTVGYDPALAGFLSGAGTAVLRVRGFAITVNATGLGLTQYAISDEPRTLNNSAQHVLQLLPGSHRFSVPMGWFSFRVDTGGGVGYDAGQAGYLSGAGTSTLIVKGYTITIDATPLAPTQFQLMLESGTWTNDRPHAFQVLPGQHDLNGGQVITFLTVAPDGTFSLTGSLPLFMSGGGTSTVTLNGFPVTIDATASSFDFSLAGQTGVYSHTAPHTVRLLPGNHFYTAEMPGNDPWGFGFTISASGVITIDPDYTGAAMQGASTITVTGP